MSASVRNVAVVNCIFDGTQRGLRVKTALGRGGVIEHFRASNLVMRNITDVAFSITAAYESGTTAGTAVGEGAPAPESVPAMRHIHWSDISIANTKKIAEVSALKEAPLEDFSLRNVHVASAVTGIACDYAKHVRFENVDLPVVTGPALQAKNVSDLAVLGLSVPEANPQAPVMSFKEVSGARVQGCEVHGGQGVFLHTDGKDDEDLDCGDNHLGPDVKETER
jgi:hypothetical protein